MGLDAQRLEMIRANAAFAIGEWHLTKSWRVEKSILSFYNVCVEHIATGKLGKAVASEAS